MSSRRSKFNRVIPLISLVNSTPKPAVHAPESAAPSGSTVRRRVLTAHPSGEIQWHDQKAAKPQHP